MIPAGRHSDSDSTLLPLPKSAITWFGGIFARLREKCLLGCWTIPERSDENEVFQFHRQRGVPELKLGTFLFATVKLSFKAVHKQFIGAICESWASSED